MSLHRFFLTEQVLSQEVDPVFELRLSEDDSRHAKTLRLKPNEHIAVIDADSDYFECEIRGCDEGRYLVSICSHGDLPRKAMSLSLICAIPKSGKLEEVIKHATEVGVDAFYPFEARRSISKLDASKAQHKLERWSSVAKNAAMQSGRSIIPSINLLGSLSDISSYLGHIDALFVCYEEASTTDALISVARKAFLDVVESTKGTSGTSIQSIAIAIGPEGGFDPNEVDSLMSSTPNSHLVSLGPTILRYETACIVSAAIVEALGFEIL